MKDEEMKKVEIRKIESKINNCEQTIFDGFLDVVLSSNDLSEYEIGRLIGEFFVKCSLYDENIWLFKI